MELKGFTREVLEQAVRLYVEEAYAGAPLPPAVAARLQWPAGESLAELAAGPTFERRPADVPPAECQRIRLRLGNRLYPHMKFGVDHVPHTDEWVLTADCHDVDLLAAAQGSEREAAQAILRHNADVKARIERRWNEAGLPTFERYVRTRLAGRP